MNSKILITGAVVAILAAGAASASPRHHGDASGRGKYAAPAQPIPYAQLDAYLKATPKERMAMSASAGAATGTETNASAAVPSTAPEATPSAAMPAPAAPATDMPGAGQPVNPPAPPPATTPPPTPDASTAPK